MPRSAISVFRSVHLVSLLIFLAVSLTVFALTYQSGFQGDEGRYARLAHNLREGHFSDRNSVSLWSGPGYPIILVPFVLCGLPWWTAKAFNIVLLLAAMLYFAATLRLYLPNAQRAAPAAIVGGLYPPFQRYLSQLLTETLALFLVCGFLYHFARANRGWGKRRKHLLTASLFLGWLALTKIAFGYVIMAGGLVTLVAWVGSRDVILRRSFLVTLLAFVLCVPYLAYTRALTGKLLCWGTSGGMSLYWMASPYPGELGSWHSGKEVQENPRLQAHRAFFQSIEGLSEVDADAAFREKALTWFRAAPDAYLHNWLANLGRLMFNYPFTAKAQSLSTYVYLVPNMFIVVLFVLSIPPALVASRQVPKELKVLVLFGFLSAAINSIPSATNRQFQILIPVFALWMCFIYDSLFRVVFRAWLGAVRPSDDSTHTSG